ncbi:sphingosine kinase 1 [Zeugodacus cucurbitae]|uniref:sphingosine kinase n=1 Tax=Zeugodacus cucurbitae TaxID=28588 RepID=A0A0A1WJ54_ZEUCU|nr:sphingosine kinase 1 [Zeugodacus cucurbitae]XP_011185061.2 sphingosine kinase 1 [Zeugodacus cucurbitae]
MRKGKVLQNPCKSFCTIMDPCRNLSLDLPDTSYVYDNTAASVVNTPLSPTSSVAKISPNGVIELSELFYINNKQKTTITVEVKLNAEGIFLRRETGAVDEISEQRIRMEDIIGSSCGPRLKKSHRGALASCRRIDDESEAEQAAQKDISAYLHIYAYIKNEKSSMRRERTVRILRFRSFDTYEENVKVAERWHHAIRINQAALKNQLVEKQLLIFLNPKSGSGKGREMFHKQVAPVLKEADVPYELHVTAHYNFAREYVRKHSDLLHCYSGIVVASGDGLYYEVLNGIMEREDWRAITRQIPLGIIPCGSGNGLARSIAHLYKEPYEPKPILYATLTCIAGKLAPMDLVRIDTGKEGKACEMYSFLSVGWGLIADIDIESERLRSIGASRFTFWTIRRLIGLRTYSGKLSYIRCERKDARKTFGTRVSTVSNEERRLPPEVQEFYDIPNPPAGIKDDDFVTKTNNKEDDEFGDAISLDRVSFRSNADSWHSAMSKRTAYFSVTDQSLRSRRSVLSRLESINLEYESRRPPSTIPTLDQPLPADTWHTEEGEYVMVHAAYTTHLSSDCFFAPDSRLNDGIIYLVIIRGGVGRSQLAHFLLGMSSGTHLPKEPNKYIEVVPVRAFRIEPSPDKEGIMAVDGERVDYGPLQGEILPGMIKVMVPNGNAID